MTVPLPPLHVQIIPHMAGRDLAAAAVEAERLGYAGFWLSDEGFMTDPFTALGLAAAQTSTIRLGVITNPYTRHPAMTATAIATLDEMSSGRAELCYVAGGSLVLDPLALPRPQPVETVREAILLTRELLDGHSVTWQGSRFQLHNARIDMPTRADLPIHVAARGPHMLSMAAQVADAVWVGIDERGVGDLTMIREAAGACDHTVRIVGGDHPPFNATVADALSEAMRRDGSINETPVKTATLADWGASFRQSTAQHGIDDLLVVTWEATPDLMRRFLREVWEALALV